MADDEKNDDGFRDAPATPGAALPKKTLFSDDFDNPDRREDMDELPEEEPLTPELVEEEAIRGDFMLRWATVFLAILMAFTQISDTKPLVLIRSGEQMRAAGGLPQRADQLSLTMEGKSITNVGWLFDHLVSFAWQLGGDKGLTGLKVLVAAFIGLILSRISIPGLPTWWSSVCTGFAIVACSQDFIPAHELITILGMALLMQFIAGHRLGQGAGLLWKLPALFVVWCNLDPRAWVGVFVVVLYALGSAIHRRGLIRQGLAEERIPAALGLPAVLCVAALLVNPFPLASLTSPLSMYTREYPAMQAQKSLRPELAAGAFDNRVDYYSVLNPGAIRLFDHSHIAALTVMLMAFAVLMLSMGTEAAEARRSNIVGSFFRGLVRTLRIPEAFGLGRPVREAGFLFVLLGLFLLALMAAHELPAAAVACAVMAGISAQDWYRRSFSMTYTVDSTELLFSRGGRAVTVLAMALLGFAVVASRLPGAAPLGFGFDPETRITVETLSSQIKSLDPKARIFHTRVDQGDLLIWNGRKSFVDSRILPFTSSANPVFEQHDVIRSSVLRPPADLSGISDPTEKKSLEAKQQQNQVAAKEALQNYGITHVMSRLAPPGVPDYQTMLTLAATGEFIPVSIGASAAVLEKISPTMSQEAVAAKIPKFIDMAFRDTKPMEIGLRQFASPQGFYDRYVYRNRPFTNANRRIAQHYMALATTNPNALEEAMSAIALLTLSIRNLNQSLQDYPDDTSAYVLLGQAYFRLGLLEQTVNGGEASIRLRQTRYFQAVAAFRQVVKADPDSIRAWEGLMTSYEAMGRQDLLLEALERWLELAEKEKVSSEQRERFEQYRTQRFAQQRELEDLLVESDAQLDKQIEEQIAANAAAMEASKAQAAKAEQANVVSEENENQAREAILSAVLANSAGRPRRALNSLQDKAALVRGVPMGVVLLGQLLLETGELEEAHQLLLGLSQDALKQPEAFLGTEWQLPVAISQLGVCDYELAAETWSTQLKDIERELQNPTAYMPVLFSLPLIADANFEVNGALPVWPFRNSMALNQQIAGTNDARAELMLMQAVVKIEQADCEAAKQILKTVLTELGENRVRGLALIYYAMLDVDSQKVLEPFNVNPWEEFDYPGEPVPPPPPAGATGGAAPGGATPAGANGPAGAPGLTPQPAAGATGAVRPAEIGAGALPGVAP